MDKLCKSFSSAVSVGLALKHFMLTAVYCILRRLLAGCVASIYHFYSSSTSSLSFAHSLPLCLLTNKVFLPEKRVMMRQQNGKVRKERKRENHYSVFTLQYMCTSLWSAPSLYLVCGCHEADI